MLKFLSKILGSKSARDIKHIQPLVDKIKAEYDKLQGLSNDELRAKTPEFKQRIEDYLADITAEISSLRANAEEPSLEMAAKNEIYEKVDKLEKDWDKKLEEILLEILPEAFAVVKDTARRFTKTRYWK